CLLMNFLDLDLRDNSLQWTASHERLEQPAKPLITGRQFAFDLHATLTLVATRGAKLGQRQLYGLRDHRAVEDFADDAAQHVVHDLYPQHVRVPADRRSA